MVGSYLGSIAKAITAFLLTLIVGFLTDKGLVVDENALSALIEAFIAGFFVWLVPNSGYVGPRRTVTTTERAA